MREKSLRWFDHVMRRSNFNTIKVVMEINNEKKRRDQSTIDRIDNEMKIGPG